MLELRIGQLIRSLAHGWCVHAMRCGFFFVPCSFSANAWLVCACVRFFGGFILCAVFPQVRPRDRLHSVHGALLPRNLSLDAVNASVAKAVSKHLKRGGGGGGGGGGPPLHVVWERPDLTAEEAREAGSNYWHDQVGWGGQ